MYVITTLMDQSDNQHPRPEKHADKKNYMYIFLRPKIKINT